MDETNFNLHISRRDGQFQPVLRVPIFTLLDVLVPMASCTMKFKEDLFERKAHSLGGENV